MKNTLNSLLAVLILTGCQSIPEKNSKDFLSDHKYKNLEIEILSTPNAQPSETAVSNFCEKIAKYCHKDSISVIKTTIDIDFSNFNQAQLPQLVCSWNISDILNYEVTYSKLHIKDDTLVIHILYLPGTYTSNFSTIGLSYSKYSFVVFKNKIENQNLEEKVLLHEFGHLLNLVKNIMHKDRENGNHCSEKECVMYWSLNDDTVFDFGRKCKEDLVRNGGKCD